MTEKNACVWTPIAGKWHRAVILIFTAVSASGSLIFSSFPSFCVFSSYLFVIYVMCYLMSFYFCLSLSLLVGDYDTFNPYPLLVVSTPNSGSQRTLLSLATLSPYISAFMKKKLSLKIAFLSSPIRKLAAAIERLLQGKLVIHLSDDSSKKGYQLTITSSATAFPAYDWMAAPVIPSPAGRTVPIAGRSGLTFLNWAETFSCKPELYFEPNDVDQVREIVLLAKANGKKVRVFGRGHSPSDLSFTNDYLISLRNFDRILHTDEDSGRVRVEAGITIEKLNQELLHRKLALSVLGSVSDLTLGGVISTATHGSGIRFNVISGYVREVELMTSSGDLLKCSASEKSDVFYSCLCGLGAIGILINVTIQCEPAFALHELQMPSTLDQVLDDLDDHLQQSDHFRFLWFPHTDHVSLCHTSRVRDLSVRQPFSLTRPLISWFWKYAVGYYALELAYWLSTFAPRTTPWINRIWFYLQYSKPTERVDESYKIFGFECLFRQHVYEWSIPKEKTQIVLTEMRRFLDTNPDVNVHFPVEVRFVAADDIYLSPAYGRDSCYINIIMYRPYGKHVPFRRWWDAYEAIVKEAGGRPHWAKAHSVTAAEFVRMYPYFRAWAQVRKRLDPISTFSNDYLTRIFATYPKD